MKQLLGWVFHPRQTARQKRMDKMDQWLKDARYVTRKRLKKAAYLAAPIIKEQKLLRKRIKDGAK